MAAGVWAITLAYPATTLSSMVFVFKIVQHWRMFTRGPVLHVNIVVHNAVEGAQDQYVLIVDHNTLVNLTVSYFDQMLKMLP